MLLSLMKLIGASLGFAVEVTVDMVLSYFRFLKRVVPIGVLFGLACYAISLNTSSGMVVYIANLLMVADWALLMVITLGIRVPIEKFSEHFPTFNDNMRRIAGGILGISFLAFYGSEMGIADYPPLKTALQSLMLLILISLTLSSSWKPEWLLSIEKRIGLITLFISAMLIPLKLAAMAPEEARNLLSQQHLTDKVLGTEPIPVIDFSIDERNRFIDAQSQPIVLFDYGTGIALYGYSEGDNGDITLHQMKGRTAGVDRFTHKPIQLIKNELDVAEVIRKHRAHQEKQKGASLITPPEVPQQQATPPAVEPTQTTDDPESNEPMNTPESHTGLQIMTRVVDTDKRYRTNDSIVIAAPIRPIPYAGELLQPDRTLVKYELSELRQEGDGVYSAMLTPIAFIRTDRPGQYGVSAKRTRSNFIAHVRKAPAGVVKRSVWGAIGGAMLGFFIEGDRGAVKGAAVGAGAGATSAVVQRIVTAKLNGTSVQIPVKTLISFTLINP